MATLLDNRLVADAMTNLCDWQGDANFISRTVRVDDMDRLLAAVTEAADAANHHPDVERKGDSVTFKLWTHSEGGVTELDIALASRIDDLVLAGQDKERGPHGRVRSVVGATTDEGAVEGRTVTASPNIRRGGQTTPSRPEESTTGEPYPASPGTDGRDAGTFNEAAAPRQDAGLAAVPDSEPNSAEPQPGNAPAPGMHEPDDG
jgi:4a-hydroxytetrahydrobiopterin dehydratase